MVSKAIGMYDTCRHFCVYCYVSTGKGLVRKCVAAFGQKRKSGGLKRKEIIVELYEVYGKQSATRKHCR